MKQTTWIAILLLFAAGSCTNNTQDQSAEEGMAQFADDAEFKDAHDEPGALAFEAQGEMITFPTPDGKTGSAYALMAESETDKYLLVIHEWWGLNDHIKAEAERLYEQLDDVHVMALDMYDGKVATTRDQAGQYMKAMTEERGKAIVRGALNKAGGDARIGTIGWCFGGGWSLQASILAGEQGEACVIYYGMPVQKADALAPLKAPILGIFAEQDGWITPEVVNEFESLAQATGKSIQVHQFDAEHAFANPSNPQYDAEATQKAHALALAFLQEHL